MTKPRCKNCGDETSFPKTAKTERVEFGWCVPCYRAWFNNTREDDNGNIVDRETGRVYVGGQILQ